MLPNPARMVGVWVVFTPVNNGPFPQNLDACRWVDIEHEVLVIRKELGTRTAPPIDLGIIIWLRQILRVCLRAA
jgi:hypothetical protein